MPSLNGVMNQDNLKGLPWMVALTQAVGIAMIVLVGVWLNKFLGGFAWDGSPKEFNLHPLCMVCGMIFLYGEAILVYRIFRKSEKTKVKLIHGGLFTLAFIAIVIGLTAVFQFHNASNIQNMYSMHSWCGMATVLLFCFQLTLGFLSFLLPGASKPVRAFYLPIHQYFGSAILTLATISAISGINEKLFFVLGNTGYPTLPGSAVLGNCCGLVIIAFVVIVLFIVHRPEWKRDPDPEEEAVSVHFRTLTNGDSDSE